MKLRPLLSAAVLAVGLTSAANAQVTGKITFDGKAPAPKKVNIGGVAQCAAMHPNGLTEESLIVAADKGLKNALVAIKVPGAKAPADAAVLDQKGCQYVPHVLPVMVGQPIKVKNSDPFLHNVHSFPETNKGFNFGQPNIDPGKDVGAMKAAEPIRVKCDVHPWMNAYIVVLDTPFFAVTGDDGTFSIKDVPNGAYDAVIWHEKTGETTVKVTVKDGKAEIKQALKREEEAALDIKTVELTSLTGEQKATCPTCAKAEAAKAKVD
jgi:hypothetical protein